MVPKLTEEEQKLLNFAKGFISTIQKGDHVDGPFIKQLITELTTLIEALAECERKPKPKSRKRPQKQAQTTT